MREAVPLNLQTELRRHFNFDNFRPGQEAAISAILSKRNLLVVMPTGAGKSLCYQLPALLQTGTTIVVSPLIALMKDQVGTLRETGKAATFINSSLSASEVSSRVRDMRAGKFRLVYVAPERFRSQSFLSAIAGVTVDLFVVDEAHCISHWGHDFRPDYLTLKNVIAQLNQPSVAALTATATLKVQDDIIKQLGLQNCQRIVTGFNRPNLSFEVEYTPDDDAKSDLLVKLLQGKKESAIVYTATRRGAEEAAEFIRLTCKVKTDHYHAGLEATERSRFQDSFMKDETTVIVATNAFGMGVDKPDIRAVIHYNLPGALEAYYQEAGRAGRDGLPARAVLLYSPKDIDLQYWFIKNSFPTREELELIYHVLKNISEDGRVRTNSAYLQKATRLYETKVRVAIAELVKAQALVDLGDEAANMNFKILPLKQANLGPILQEIARRLEYKYQQLEQMVGYAQCEQCRRRFILDHFGDTGSAEAERCCDNCLAAREQEAAKAAAPAPKRDAAGDFSAAEKVALIILHAVKHLKREVGRGRLVEILSGSQSKEIFEFGWNRTKAYGRLSQYTQPQCRDFIDQLLKMRYLTLVGADYPVLDLTPKGAAALQNLESIPLDLNVPPTPAPYGSPLRQISQMPLTVQQTLSLFRQGLSPQEIAERRGLTATTVFGHFADLIRRNLVQVSAIVSVEKMQKIREVIREVGTAALKPIKEKLPENFSYDEIRCVVSDEARRRAASSNGVQDAPASAALAVENSIMDQ
jgi:ATP-dependent DNA helicase RecQ